MKIYRSTEYVKEAEREQPWYSLEVINQWDWENKAVCFDYAGAVLISYCLKLNTKTGEGFTKLVKIETLTGDMKQELIKMGYKLK